MVRVEFSERVEDVLGEKGRGNAVGEGERSRGGIPGYSPGIDGGDW